MKKIYNLIPYLSLSTLALPVVTFAQNFGNTNVASGTNAEDVLDTIADLINIIIPILISLGVVYFIWGVIQYVTAKDEEKKKEARSVMISGIIGLFVILAIWGIIGLISSTFGIGVGGQIDSNMQPGVQFQ